MFGAFAAVTLPFAVSSGRTVMWMVGVLLLASIVWLSPRDEAEETRPAPSSSLEQEPPATLVAPDPQPAACTARRALPEGPLDLQALLARLFAAAESLAPSAAHVWVEDEASRSFRLLAATGPLPPGPRPCSIHDEPVGEAWASGEPRTAPLAAIRLGDDDKMLWRVAVPLDDAAPRAVAALDILSAAEPSTSAVCEVVDALRLPIRAAIALRLAACETSAARALCDALSLLDEAASSAEVLELALEGATRLAEAATASVMLSGEDGTLRIAAARGLPSGFLGSEMREGEGVAGWVAMTRAPLLIEDQPRLASRPRPSAGPTSISVPLLAGERLVGVLNVGCRDYPAQPVGPTLAALGMLGRRIGSLLAR